MKESYGEDLANHPGPESYAGHRKVAGEALTGGSAGQPLSCEITIFSVPTLLEQAEGNTKDVVKSETSEDLAQSETLRAACKILDGCFLTLSPRFGI